MALYFTFNKRNKKNKETFEYLYHFTNFTTLLLHYYFTMQKKVGKVNFTFLTLLLYLSLPLLKINKDKLYFILFYFILHYWNFTLLL